MATSIPSGTITKFMLGASPQGWTKLNTYNDYTLRVVSGVVGFGGTQTFSTVFTSQAASGTVSVGPLTLADAVGPSPNHTHLFPYAYSSSAGAVPPSFSGTNYAVFGQTATRNTSSAAGSGAVHGHPITSPGSIPVSTNMNFALKYVDAILAQRD